MALRELEDHLRELVPAPRLEMVSAGSLDLIRTRLAFLIQVGLGYLHLHRPISSLSAGENQRIQLAGLLGSGLTSLTVIMDEPTRGLHPSEVEALVDALAQLREAGNTLIVVEHDPVVIAAADHLLEVGPGAGRAGGQIVAAGPSRTVRAGDSLTARWLRGERKFVLRSDRRLPQTWMTLRGARAHNLRIPEIRIPLGLLTGVCGVSGSGKSVLIVDILGRTLAPTRHTTSVAYEPLDPGEHDAIEGAPARSVIIDQTLAGVSSPAAYLKLDLPLRRFFAESASAAAGGWTVSDLKRGCTTCKGRGSTRQDMGFLPTVHRICETCQGTGFKAEAWQVRARGYALPELDALSLEEILERYGDVSGVGDALHAAQAVGLGYLRLRQPRRALSGGEAQRLKIAAELIKRGTQATLYLLDEPTLGQHLEDVQRLLGVLQNLVEHSGTVLVVEHHPHVLASCDWLLELGPGGGPEGGRLIAEGPPEHLAAGSTPTARYIRQALEGVG
jgi:excinuclease ABC subunit A